MTSPDTAIKRHAVDPRRMKHWYIDVDGVVNSIGQPSKARHPGYEKVAVLGYPIWFSPEIVARITAISRRGDVEPVWLTTWGDLAVSELSPAIGLPAFRALDNEERFLARHPGTAFERHGMSTHGPWWWKAGALLEDTGALKAAPGEPVVPVVWTDDDLARQTKHRIRPILGASLLITPMSAPGLTTTMLDQIEDFLDTATPAPARG